MAGRIILFRVFHRPKYMGLSLAFLLFTTGLSHKSVFALPPLQEKDILKAHNAIREKIGVGPLQWSEEIADYAQYWADYLAANEDCRMVHRKKVGKDSKPYGENIYWASSIRWSDGRTGVQQVSPPDVVAGWAAEEQFYDQATGNCQTGRSCGHYTQLIWRETEKLGCGMRICSDNSQVWVCNYSPPGNIADESPFE